MPFMRNPGRRGTNGKSAKLGGRRGPKIPSVLMAEVDVAYGKSNNSGRDERSRKDRRKPARDEQEKQTRPRFQARHTTPLDQDREPTQNLPTHAPSLTHRVTPVISQATKKRKPHTTRSIPELALPGTEQPDAEDQEIEWLEWVLKKDKGKAKAPEDALPLEDGLDELLDFADIIGPGGSGRRQPAESALGDERDGLEDDTSSGSGMSVDEDEISERGTLEGESSGKSHVSGVADEDGLSSPGSANDQLSRNATVSLQAGGRLRDAPATKYIPPQLRAAQLEEKARGNKQKVEELVRLERKAQGLLNKLSEANIESILGEMEVLYRGHSRHDVTNTLTSLLIQTVSSRSNLLEPFVVLHAMLVGALYRVIGVEFGAHLVGTLVKRYHTLITDPSQAVHLAATIYETPDASKEGLNLLAFMSELYNAGIVSAKLIYDLVRNLLNEDDGEIMRERDVEGLLRILRCCGGQLRSDDPASLKDIVKIVQERTKGREQAMTSRARFLVETLTNVKNNKLRSTSGAELGIEAADRMKKFLSSLGHHRRLLATEPLRVGLDELLTAETDGKWWLVGAGWSGDPLVEHQQEIRHKRKRGEEAQDEDKLLDVARQQGMNTDVRRSIFVVLMTSEDYMHACDRLSHLRLTDVQRREFVRVAWHCAGLEKIHNPYYTLILNSLCASSHDHRFTLQYTLWDFLRVLEESSGGNDLDKSEIVAQVLAFIIARGSLDLSVFKTVDWTSLNKNTTDFLTKFLIHLILASQTSSSLLSLPPTFTMESFDTASLEEIVEKTLSNFALARGWLVLLGRQMEGGKAGRLMKRFGVGGMEADVVIMGIKVAGVVLRQAI